MKAIASSLNCTHTERGLVFPDSETILKRIAASSFRARFKLSQFDIDYVADKGIATIESHARDFVQKRLAARDSVQDGKQTPFRGHPIFIAQHATATCCRSCLEKWYELPADRLLTALEVDDIVGVLMAWIRQQLIITKYRPAHDRDSLGEKKTGAPDQLKLFE